MLITQILINVRLTFVHNSIIKVALIKFLEMFLCYKEIFLYNNFYRDSNAWNVCGVFFAHECRNSALRANLMVRKNLNTYVTRRLHTCGSQPTQAH